MKRTGVMLAVIFALGIAVGGLGHQRLSAQPESVTRTALLKTDVAGAEGKEAVMVFAEIAPKPRHNFVYIGGEFSRPCRVIVTPQNCRLCRFHMGSLILPLCAPGGASN